MDGIGLVAAVAAMLIVFVALVTLANSTLSTAGAPFGLALTLQAILGWILSPTA